MSFAKNFAECLEDMNICSTFVFNNDIKQFC